MSIYELIIWVLTSFRIIDLYINFKLTVYRLINCLPWYTCSKYRYTEYFCFSKSVKKYLLLVFQEFAKVVELEFVKTDLIPTFTNLSSDEQVHVVHIT